MSFTAPTAVVNATTGVDLESLRADAWRSDTRNIPARLLTDAALVDLAEAGRKLADAAFVRMVESIQAARAGNFRPIPKFAAAPEMLLAFLSRDLIDGWVYRRDNDGHLHPYLVTSVRIERAARTDTETLFIVLEADDPSDRRAGHSGRSRRSITFEKSDVTRKKPSDVLLARGLFKETPQLKAEYLERLAEFEHVIAHGFAKQYRFTGRVLDSEDWKTENERNGHKIIHDVHPSEVPALRGYAPSVLHPDDAEHQGTGPLPVLTILRAFDLSTQDFITVNVADITEYQYDQTLGQKLILPADQRELLDILTTDISTFTADVIEGKSAGNVILGKGVPGVGKTLTAEVYSELISRPLYAIHSGTLGTNAEKIRENLETVFKRAKRWDAVLLLDEADVFVLERGENITQNAIVAEFLRTLEYFDGLLFMTTNRAYDIDDAILSRCAAIIDYRTPGPADSRRVWQVQATNQGTLLEETLLDELVAGFPDITPRDIKMLLRLSLRVAAHRDAQLSVDVFARCAIFRGLHYRPDNKEGDR